MPSVRFPHPARTSRGPIVCRFLMECVFAFVVLGSSAPAKVVYVDRDASGAGDGSSWTDAYTQIGPAVWAAADGDELWVAEGTYTEQILLIRPVEVYGGFRGTETSRMQRDWRTRPTIVDAAGAGNAFRIAQPCRVDGFTLLNGVSAEGGAITSFADGVAAMTTTTIANCRIEGNSGTYGGGIHSHIDRVEVIGCEITNNVGTEAGGIYAFNSRLAVRDCVVTGNLGLTACGGIMGRSGSEYTAVTNCSISATTITANRSGGNGGGILMIGGTHGRVLYIVDRCVISHNEAVSGAGLRLLGTGEVRDSLIVYNTASFAGGAIDSFQGFTTLRNCTLSRNVASQFGALSNWEGRLFVFNSIMYDNGAGPIGGEQLAISYSCYDGGYPGREGTINANPGFVAPLAGDFRLGPSSVCLDAGTHADLLASQRYDLDGHARIADGNNDGLAVVDMGAYEMSFWTDLAIRDFDVAPTSINPGETIHFAGRVINRGNLATTRPFWIEFLASPQLDFSGPRYFLCPSLNVTPNLGPGDAVQLGGLLRTLDPPPSGPPNGQYYVAIRVDPLNEIDESDEANNFSWVASHRLCVGPCPTETTAHWILYR